jgi:[ribosomal protein S5]-alanine N-acetyltransferase
MEAPEMLETARLRLRSPKIEDAKVIFHNYAQDPVVTRYLVWLPHQSIETTEKFIADCIDQRARASVFPYVITRKSDGDLLGMIDLRPHQHGANIGYVLAKEHWRQGIMTEAARSVVDYALAQPASYRVQAFCDVENVASARTLEKIGMHREGTLRRYIIHPAVSNEPRDCYLYAITK